MEKQNRLSWLEISAADYVHNLDFFKSRLPVSSELAVVVKANAYGHGLEEIAGLAGGCRDVSFCVHSLDEARRLRETGIDRDILIMGPVPRTRLDEVAAGNFRQVVYGRDELTALNQAGKDLKTRVRVHVKLEIGTCRQGIQPENIIDLLNVFRDSGWIELEAAYAHFANIEDTTDHSFARLQLQRFEDMVGLIRGNGFPGIKRHIACTAAILLFPDTHFEMVRLGIGQYGLWPSRETFVSYKIKHARNGEDVLRPVLSWKTRIAQIKSVAAGQSVGYGCTYQTSRDTQIAVLPVGYADGYDRRLSNQAHVLIRGRRAPIRGRVCMNFIMVDVTDIPGVNIEDEVVLMGRQDGERVSPDWLAQLIGTINYEVVTRIHPGIPRLIV